MLNQNAALDSAFRALSDGGRRAILEHLSRGEATLSDLAGPLSVTLSAVHQQVAVLEEAGLVACEKRGRSRWCRLEPRGFRLVEGWITDRKLLWDSRLRALARHLAAEDRRTGRRKGKS